MSVKRTTIELDEELVAAARKATGGTLRATVEEGLRRVVVDSEAESDEQRAAIEQHRIDASQRIDVDVLLSGEAWR